MVKVGEVAPDFETTTESGEKFRLSAMRGKRLMLYFYPKDDTPGCTAEACSIRDSYAAFKSNNALVFGVSGGQVSSHKGFKAKYSLPFPLLMDEEYRIAKLYGVYGPKKLYGKDYMGIERTTFLINQQGKVEGIFGGPEGAEKVDTKEHAQQVIKFWGFKLQEIVDMLAIGDKAPDFQTTTDSGESFRLSDKRGKKIVLYFYPADDTPGCTAEACSIRDSYDTFLQKGVDVYGISGGSRESHERFKQKHRLNFPLLMDEDHAIAKLFRVYKPTKILGKELLGVQRVTFLIDGEGKIEGIYGGSEGLDKVKTREHADQILNFWGLKL